MLQPSPAPVWGMFLTLVTPQSDLSQGAPNQYQRSKKSEELSSGIKEIIFTKYILQLNIYPVELYPLLLSLLFWYHLEPIWHL